MDDGPRRKTTEESESLEYVLGTPLRPGYTRRSWRPDVGHAEMAEAMTGRRPWGGSSLLHRGTEMRMFFKYGERNRSARGRFGFTIIATA